MSDVYRIDRLLRIINNIVDGIESINPFDLVLSKRGAGALLPKRMAKSTINIKKFKFPFDVDVFGSFHPSPKKKKSSR